MLKTRISTMVTLAAAAAVAASAAAGEAPALLSENRHWRAWFRLETPVVRKDGQAEPAKADGYVCSSPAVPAGWAAADFDDSEWPRWRPVSGVSNAEAGALGFGFESAGAPGPAVSAICLRARFRVADPAEAAGLRLSLGFRGGAVVYVNGQELARAHLAKDGPLAADALAEDYPAEVFMRENNRPIRADFGDPGKYREVLGKRLRRIESLAIDPKLLRPGVNVLAVELRRAPYFGPGLGMEGLNYRSTWGTCGLVSVRLQGAGASTAVPAGTVTVANHPAGQWTEAAAPADGAEALRPVRLAGARNGTFSGQVVLSSDSPLTGVRAAASDLKAADGGAVIPASAVELRYAAKAAFGAGAVFDALEDAPPAANGAGKAAAVQPVWITVHVPRDARPGSYAGRVSLEAGGRKVAEVPVELSVADFALADARDFAGFLDVVDSPRTLALRYNVPVWSEEHWKLVERNFELMGQLGSKVVYLTILPDTYFGNGEGMIRWVRKEVSGVSVQVSGASKKEGEASADTRNLKPDTLTPDFGPVERYLDLAVKHLGKVPVVCAYLWDRRSGTMNYTDSGNLHTQQTRGAPITIVDPQTQASSAGEGPLWGTPESRTFWRPAVEGLKERLEKRGLGKSLVWGLATDRRPRKETVEDLKALAPEVPWACHSHPLCENIHGHPVRYILTVWAAPHISAKTPAARKLGWQNPQLIGTFPRLGAGGVGSIYDGTAPLKYRAGIEGMMICGYRGLGRVGGGFWSIPAGKGEPQNVLRTTPDVGETWGIGFEAAITQLLAPGRSGPVATVRHEMFRENLQEIEARVCLEKALADPARRAKLGEALAARCQALLDERGQAIAAGNLGPGWLAYQQGLTDRTARLYAAAAEAAAKAGGK